MKPVKYKDFTLDLENYRYCGMKELVDRMNEYICTAKERPLNPVNVETHFTGEGQYFLRLWYREGWER